MNRIVIVGNGYDLFRNLNTKYEHFVIEYLKRKIENARKNTSKKYEDRLITVEYGHKVVDSPKELESTETIEEFNKIEKIKIEHQQFESEFIYSQHPDLKEPEKYITIKLKSRLFQKIFKDLKWADIERIYYDELLEVHKRSISDKIELSLKNPTNLNKDFELIRHYLIEYLKKISSNLPRDFMTPQKLDILYRRLNEEIDSDTFKKYFSNCTNYTDTSIDNIKFLNFNYTEQLYIDLKRLSIKEPDIIHIHGDLGIPDSVIFGYGDNSNENYNKLRKTDNSEFLKYLKHYRYRTNDDLDNFYGLLEKDCFEVVVIGHSLGISDRYILSRIFNHKKCKLIRIFSRGGKYKYNDKLAALSLHFDNDDWENKVAIYNKEDTFH